MNLNYCQTTGLMTQDDGTQVAKGWAGRQDGKNEHEMESVHNTGPLPCGTYDVGAWGDHGALGPDSAPLTQTSGESFGRNGFYIHGPGTTDYGQESKGCIVIPRSERLVVEGLAPDTITVSA